MVSSEGEELAGMLMRPLKGVQLEGIEEPALTQRQL